MRKILLDLGGYNGCSVRYFRRAIDKSCEYEIFTFEPAEEFHKYYEGIKNHNLIKKAVWVEDCQKDFYISKKANKDGSTLFEEKNSGGLDYDNPIKIDCVDICKWIKENFSKDDFIVLKMDIEGAEYQVLEKMIKDKTVEYIDKFYIDWHWHRIPSISQEYHDEFIKKLPFINNIWPNLGHTKDYWGI